MDQHHIEALDCSGLYIHGSLHTTILGNTINIILSTSSGIEVLTFLFEAILMVSFDHMEHMKSALKPIKLMDFPGKILPISASISDIPAIGLIIPDNGMNNSWLSWPKY